MLRLACLLVLTQSAARTNDHCSCHSVKSKIFTRLMFERGFRAAAAHRASDLWLADHAAALEQLRQAESGEAPLGGTARKHLGLS